MRTAYFKGQHFRPLCNSTIQRLLARGFQQVVWKNGDFLIL